LQRTPLHWACVEGQVDTMEILLRGGATVEARDYRGQTPLHHSCSMGHLRVSQLLVQRYHADVSVTSNDLYRTPLHFASIGGNLEVVQFLLSLGADINALEKYGRAPIYFASDLSVVSYLAV
ncbi:unnamed protein product, partial [Discosporangium mesarthrocarpum]